MSAENSNLRRVRCFNHSEREATARCPVCQSHFCRECITENNGVMICARCLSKSKKLTIWSRNMRELIFLSFMFMFSFFIMWSIFYSVGHIFSLIPEKYHEGAFINHILTKALEPKD